MLTQLGLLSHWLYKQSVDAMCLPCNLIDTAVYSGDKGASLDSWGKCSFLSTTHRICCLACFPSSPLISALNSLFAASATPAIWDQFPWASPLSEGCSHVWLTAWKDCADGHWVILVWTFNARSSAVYCCYDLGGHSLCLELRGF